MSNIYLNLLFLYGVLCQGIIETISEKDIGESSDLLDRQKRVINRAPGEDLRQLIKSVPYVVFIREIRSENHCPGTILTNNIVLTVAKCVLLPPNKYAVYTASSRIGFGRRSNVHDVTDKEIYYGNHPYRSEDGVALISIHPPVSFNSAATKSIPFFEGVLHPGTLATVSGWGCDESGAFQTQHSSHLRSILVPIISTQECGQRYHRVFAIGEADICTLDPNQQRYCTPKDAGAPLVVEVNNVPHLAGIHLWNGGIAGRQNPDVFINLQHPGYKAWLTENVHRMQENVYNNPHIHG